MLVKVLYLENISVMIAIIITSTLLLFYLIAKQKIMPAQPATSEQIEALKKSMSIINQRLDIHEEMLNNLNKRIERHDEMFAKVIRFMEVMPDYVDAKSHKKNKRKNVAGDKLAG